MSFGPVRCTPAAALRGGNWNNGADAGVTALNLNNSGSNSNWNIGFRCARPRYGLGLSDLDIRNK